MCARPVSQLTERRVPVQSAQAATNVTDASISHPGVKFIQSMAEAECILGTTDHCGRNFGRFQADGSEAEYTSPPRPWRPCSLEQSSMKWLVLPEREEDLEDDEDDDDELQERRPASVDFAPNEGMGLRQESLLRVDARLPRANPEPADRAFVDARKVEVANDFERIVHSFGELAELDQATDDAAPEVHPGIADDIGNPPARST